VKANLPDVTANTKTKEENIKKLEKPNLKIDIKDKVLDNAVINQLDKKEQNSNGNDTNTQKSNVVENNNDIPEVVHVSSDNKDRKSSANTNQLVDEVDAPIVVPIDNDPKDIVSNEENDNKNSQKSIELVTNSNNNQNNIDNNQDEKQFTDNSNDNEVVVEPNTLNNNELNKTDNSEKKKHKESLNAPLNKVLDEKSIIKGEAFSIDPNYGELMETGARSEVIGGKNCDIRFTDDEPDLIEAFNNKIDTYPSLNDSEQKVENIDNLPPEKKITRIITFDFIDVEDDENIRKSLVHNIIRNIEVNILTQDDLDEINNLTTQPLIQKDKEEEDLKKFSEKQRQYVKKIVSVNSSIGKNPIPYTKKDIPILSKLDKIELQTLNNNICNDQELISSIDRNEIELLPQYEVSKIKKRIRNTPIGSSEFKKLRESIFYENVNELRKIAMKKNLKNLLPEKLVNNNIKELEEVIMAKEYDPIKLLHYKIKLSKINRFYNMIKDEEIVVVTVSEEDLKSIAIEEESEKDDSRLSKRKYNNFKKIALKDFFAYYETQEHLKNDNDHHEENNHDTNNKKNEKDNHHSQHKASILIRNYVDDYSEKPAIIDLKEFKDYTASFFKKEIKEDYLKIAFFNPDFESKETAFSEKHVKNNVLDKLFSLSINDVNTIRVSVRDHLNYSFTDLMKKHANPKQKSRYSIFNKYAKGKRDSLLFSAKDILKDIGENDHDEIENERLKYFDSKKQQYNLNQSYQEEGDTVYDDQCLTLGDML